MHERIAKIQLFSQLSISIVDKAWIHYIKQIESKLGEQAKKVQKQKVFFLSFKNREKFRGSEHFFWDYRLNTRRANALRVDHKKIQKDPFFPFF